MIKKQISWQAEKFTFSSDGSKNQVYQQLRNEMRNLLKNENWEVISQDVVGYDPSSGDVVIVIGMAKYEYVDEPVNVAKEAIDAAVKSVGRGRPAKEK